MSYNIHIYDSTSIINNQAKPQGSALRVVFIKKNW